MFVLIWANLFFSVKGSIVDTGLYLLLSCNSAIFVFESFFPEIYPDDKILLTLTIHHKFVPLLSSVGLCVNF